MVSSLPTLLFMICLPCFAPMNRSVQAPWAEHCTSWATVNPSSCQLLCPVLVTEKKQLRQSPADLVSVTHSWRSMGLEYFALLCLLHKLGISFASESEASQREGQHPSMGKPLAQDGVFTYFPSFCPTGHPSSTSPLSQPRLLLPAPSFPSVSCFSPS